MSVFSALYTLLIGPLELFFEILYSMVNRVLEDPGLSIIFLSLAMNFLVLPLYKRADALQEEERVTDARLKPWVTHIKKTFKGDERFMILQTYYRQNNYKTTDPLKGSVSLLLEIPFFMAAYNFLSALPLLQGASFGPIRDLGAPDAMLVLGGFAINVLPIVMTVINLISSAIYLKGAPLRSKIQLYVMAGLFLILLYDSPAGLVFYWTLNNLFSLVKNIFMKLRNPKKVFAWLSSAAGVAAIAFLAVRHPVESTQSTVLLYVLVLMLQLPLIVCYAGAQRSGSRSVVLTKKDRSTFWIGALFLTILTGAFIPAGVIHVSPEEFLNVLTRTSPLMYILRSALTAAGFFLVWSGIFYLLASDSGKKWMSFGMSALCVIAVVDFMFFGRDYGNMSPGLVFDIAPVYSHRLLNLAVVAAAAVLVWILWKKKQELLRFAILTAALAAAVMSVVNVAQIRATTDAKAEQLQQQSDSMPTIPLSRDGKNVIVLMMDRAVNSHVPYILNEKPELRQQFAGFTYYPNTISYGGYTNFGSPALFGGYEYTPAEMNRRPDESLEDKHNEALRVMPELFYNADFETTVCDPPYAGYDWIPDLSIYDAYPGMHTYNTMGMFQLKEEEAQQDPDHRQNRNFFCYSLFKIMPVFGQPYLYDNGNYNEQVSREQATSQTIESTSRATGLNPAFTEAYAVLQHLTDMTRIQDSGNTFLMLTNDTTHEPALLQEPAYEPSAVVDNTDYDAAHTDRFTLNGRTLKMETPYQVVHYQANMAAFLKLGEWFDYLRAEGLYDNTRIIMVSDHGRSLSQFEDIELVTNFNDQYDDMMLYNPLLMVKDFGSTDFTVDESFMTNADTATLAMEGLIEHPVNPFTGKPLDNSAKAGPQKVFLSHEWETPVNNGNTFLPGPWFSVEGPVFSPDSWTYLGVE